MAQLQVFGKLGMAGHIGEKHIGDRCHDIGADGKAVQPVGEVDGVGGSHDNQAGKGDVEKCPGSG